MIPMMIDDKFARMPWDQIDAVVFDVGRVLMAFSPRSVLETYLPDVPHLHDKLLVKVFKSPYWVMRDHGVITVDEAVEAMSAGEPELRPAISHIMDNWIDLKDVIQEGVDALLLCKAKGKKVYILSNYADEPFAYLEQKYDFFALCDHIFVSSRMGLVKPDPRIYDRVARETGHDPARMLFIDDAPANIEAALLCNWQGLCFNAPGKLEKFFA